MSKLLQLHQHIRVMRNWLDTFVEKDDNIWLLRGSYPDEATEEFVKWLTQEIIIDEQVGVLMLMRDAGINYTIFLKDDQRDEWFLSLLPRLSHVMGGKMGETHSDSANSAYPQEQANET